MEIDTDKILLGLVVLQTAWTAFREIAPKTGTKRDDEFVVAVDQRLSQIREKAGYFWAIVEVMQNIGKLPDGAVKSIEFMRRVKQTFGELSKVEEAEALRIAAELSKQEKENKQ